MSDRYHYDSKGNYKGRTSETPPDDGTVVLIVLAVVCAAVSAIVAAVGSVFAAAGVWFRAYGWTLLIPLVVGIGWSAIVMVNRAQAGQLERVRALAEQARLAAEAQAESVRQAAQAQAEQAQKDAARANIKDLEDKLKSALANNDDATCKEAASQLLKSGQQYSGVLFGVAELAINDIDYRARLCGIRILSCKLSGFEERSLPLLNTISKDHSEAIKNRVAATIALGTIGYDCSQTTPLLIDLLRDPEGKVQAAVCHAGKHFANSSVSGIVEQWTQVLIAALRIPHELAREEAAISLGCLRAISALQHLQRIALDTSQTPRVRQAAESAVFMIKSQTI